MKWMNSSKVRKALEQMAVALTKVDSEEAYLIRSREEVTRAKLEVEKSENRIADLRKKAKEAQGELESHGFLVGESMTPGL